MDNLTHIQEFLRCVVCGSGRLVVVADSRAIVCSDCGARFRIINSVPCFVPDDLAGFSEVALEDRSAFLDAKHVAYGGKSVISSMYNHYHGYATARRLLEGSCPRTLDIGFGVGEHYPFITDQERQSGSFIGIDLDRFKLEWFSARHPELPVLQADVFRLPIADACMDVVQILATLEHFAPTDIVRILDEALRTLKPGGVLIVCYPAEGGIMLRICQMLMHALIRIRTGFDLDRERIHHHLSTAGEIRDILGSRGDLWRIETRFYPFGTPCLGLALFVNERYRKVAVG